MIYGKTFSLLKKQFIKEWILYTNHRFIKKLSNNTLEKKVFINYLIQDYLFLNQFSKAWALAIVKADSLNEMKLSAKTVNELVNFEMKLHEKICASYGITKKKLQNAEEKNKNIAYTRYVLEIGYSGDFLDLITALVPCIIGYGEIGNNIKNNKPSNKMYKKWIATYSGKEYQNIAKNVGRLFDESVKVRLGKQFVKTYKWKKIEGIFKTATLLEIDFWEMAFE